MEKFRKSDRTRMRYKVEFICRNEHLQKFYEGLKGFLNPSELKEIKKDRNAMKRAKLIFKEFLKREDEFYPFHWDELISMMKAHSEGKWTVSSHHFTSILVLFCDEKTEKKIMVNSRFYFEPMEKMLNYLLEKRRTRGGRISENAKEPWHMAIDAVNEKDRTIMLKIRLDRKREDILEDMGQLLTLLKKEAKILGLDLMRNVKLHWDEIDKYIKVYDLKKQNQTWNDIAKQMFPVEVDWNRKHTKELATTSAKDKLRHYHRQAIKMINGGWREI